MRVHLALIFVQVSFGAFSVFGKYVLGYVHPLAVAGLRVLVAGPFLMLLALRYDKVLPKGRDLLTLAMLGFFGVFLNQLLFITGLDYTTATNASILMPSIPVFTVAIAMVMGVERITFRRSAGIGVAVAGALIMLRVTTFSFTEDTVIGNGMVLVNCLSYSIFLVLARPVLLRIPPLTVIAWTFVFGGTGVLLFSTPELLRLPVASLPILVWLGIAYVVIFPTIINYLLNTWAIKRSSSTLVAAYTTLQPVVATTLAVFLLDEFFGFREIVGFLLIVSGLLSITWKRGTISQGEKSPPGQLRSPSA
ncbi:MAG: DMT family transporter [Bacteroidetes bacterium]|nr:DMT family transporter [Bacteroidota bacterium]